MSTVKNKRKLCETSLSDFSIEQIDGVPFYSRYPEIERLFRKLVPTVEFGKCFAQPHENKARRVVEWFYSPGVESPSRLADLSNIDAISFEEAVTQRNSIIRTIESAMEMAGDNERKFLKAALSGIMSPDSDSTTFFYDGQILFGIWGMCAKQGRNLEDVIREDVLDHRVFNVNYEVSGDGSLSFSSIGRKHGHKISPSDVPLVTPAKGWSFTKWEPDIPQGCTVIKDMTFTAVCEKEELGEGDPLGIGVPPITNGQNIDTPFPDPDKPHYRVLFKNEEGGSLHGCTEYHKLEGDLVLSDEIPCVLPEDGYEFIGWEPQPDGFVVHSDVDFIAKFREKDDVYNVHFVSEDGGILEGCTDYTKHDGDSIRRDEIPSAIPDDGYEFVGWDRQPEGYEVHSDTKFVARFREKSDSWWSRFWGLGAGCLNWLLTLLLLGLIALLLWYLLGKHNFSLCGCDCGCNEYVVVPDTSITPKPKPVPIDTIHDGEDVPKPTENCGVHFSGWYLSDKDEYPWRDCSQIFEEDEFGDYVGQGYYPDNTKILPKSMKNSFDAVAVSKGTHLIIYSKPNFEGREVLNVKGPMLIENVYAKGTYGKLMTYTFKDELQELFPPERRQWSSENMHEWANGSCKIICEQCEAK